jgi:phosphate-selective porin OprO/OprP
MERLQAHLSALLGKGLVILLILAPAIAKAEPERSVVEEILDILKARGQINETEYRELIDKARREESRRKAAPAPQPVPVRKPAPAPKAPARPAAPIQAAQPPPPATTQAAAEPAKKEEGSTFRAYWKDSLRFETADGAFKMRIGGRIQLDTAIIKPSGLAQEDLDLDGLESGIEFRRARLYTEGQIYKDFGWKFEYDFADSAFKDVFLYARNVPGVQQIKLGHYKEPFSLEELTSDNFTTFMERGLPNVFAPHRRTGVGAHMVFLDQRMTWAAGGYRGDTNNLGFGFGGEQAYDLTTRLTGLPWYDDTGHLLHLGLSYSHQFRSNFELSYAQRPEAHLAPNFVDTPDFLTDGVDLLNPELALIVGPFSAQAEYIQTFVDTPEGMGDPRFFGWYGFVSYFLTGESRAYNLEDAAFERVKPHDNFGFARGTGWGALEAAARFSQLSLDSGGVSGGRLADTTLGLTWYLNPNMRILANYVYANRTPQSSANIYEARFQVDY